MVPGIPKSDDTGNHARYRKCMIIAFTMSIDDFVISYFTAGSRVETLSMRIYSMTRKQISPKINAISTLLFVSVLVLLVIINVRQSRQEAKAKELERKLVNK